MRKLLLPFLLLLSSLCIVTPLQAQTTLYVDGAVATAGTGTSWASPLKTVSAALDMANSGAGNYVINVAQGTYYPMAGTSVATSRDSSFRIYRNGIKLYGGYQNGGASRNINAYPTILSGDIGTLNDNTDNVYHVFTILPINGTATIDTNTVVDGFTITGGNGYNAAGSFTTNGFSFNHQDGGGLYIGSLAGGVCSPLIHNCMITHNSANYGGGMYTSAFNSPLSSVTVNLSGCTFSYNTAANIGGAIFDNGNSTVFSTIKSFITNCSFLHNIAPVNAGAIYEFHDTSYISNTIFIGDSTMGEGGAVCGNHSYVSYTTDSFFNNSCAYYGGGIVADNGATTITGCYFNGNKSDSSNGGAIGSNVSAVVTNSTFVNNNGIGGGAGMISGGTSSFTDCTFTGNTSTTYGGACVSAFGGAFTGINCTFSNNSTIGNGGAIYGQDTGLVSLTYCTFTGNQGASGGAICSFSPFNIVNCAMQNNTGYYGGAIYNSGAATITNTTFLQNTGGIGGAVYNAPGSAGNFNNNTYTGNSASVNGGAIYNLGGASLTIDSSTFITNNTAGSGGVLYNGGIASLNHTTLTANHAHSDGGGIYSTDSLTLANMTFQNDTSNASGGGIYNSAAASIKNCSFNANYSSDEGGGLFHTGGQTCIVDSITFTGNQSGYGGGISNDGTMNLNHGQLTENLMSEGGGGIVNSGSITVSNSIFTRNAGTDITGTIGSGGAFQNDGSSGANATINNCVIAYNMADGTNDDAGGGVMDYEGTVILNNCTLYGNTTASAIKPEGNGISVYPGATFNLNNVIVWGNDSQVYNVGTINYNYSDVRGITPPSNSINTDPQFINTSSPIGPDNTWGTSDDGLRLTPCSPAINAGSNVLIPAGITTDITTATRVQNSTVDMGAYEMPYNSTGLPSTTIGASAANPVCATTSVTFTATTLAPGSSPSYQWYKNNIPVGSNQHTYTASGWANNDTIWVVHTNPDCNLEDTSNRYVVIVPATPSQPGIIGGDTLVCAGVTKSYSVDTVSGANSYSWTVPSGWIITAGSTTDSITVTTGTNSGNVSVSAVGGCSASSPASLPVAVIPTPAAAGSITGNTAVCAGTTNTYSVGTIANATSYTWTVPAGWTITSGQGTDTITVTASSLPSSSGNISVYGFNSCAVAGPQNSLAVSSGQQASGVTISASPSGAICLSTSVQFTAIPVNSGATPGYTWRKNGIQVASGTSATYTDAGLIDGDVITVRLQSSATCVQPDSAVSLPYTMVVSAPPAAPVIGSNSPVCAGQTLNLTTSVVSGVTYNWTGPNGFSSNDQNPSITMVTAAAAGTYSLTTTNTATGCTSAPGTTAVVINPTPTTPTAGSNAPLCAGQTLDLTANTISGVTYNWTGPNSFTSTSQNPVINTVPAAAAGTYAVTVTNSTTGCTSIAGTTAVTVNTIPVIPTASSNSAICASQTLNLTTPTQPGYTYSWSGPNSFSSALQNPSISSATTAASGTYSVTITNISTGCASSAGTTAVVVNPLPATPTVNSNSPVCAGQTLNLTTAAASGATYSWIGPNAFLSNSQHPSVTAATGTYSLTITNTATGCTSAPGATAVIINPLPTTPTAGSNTPLCAGQTLDLTASTIAGVTYNWTGPNSFTSTSQNPVINTVTSAAAGTYAVTVTNNTTGCTSAAGSTAVTVNTISIIPTASSNSAICPSQTLDLSTPTQAGYTYSWSGPNSFSSALQNPSIPAVTAAASGTYSVTITNISTGCTSAAGTTDVVIKPLPATPTVSANSPVCAGADLHLMANTTTSGATYSWTGPGSFSSTNHNPTISNVTAANAGSYSVYSLHNGCQSATAASVNVTVNPVPAVTASANQVLCNGDTSALIVFSGSSVGGTVYNWTNNNTSTGLAGSGAGNIDPFKVINQGTANSVSTISVTPIANGCTGTTQTTTIKVKPTPNVVITPANQTICSNTFTQSIAFSGDVNNTVYSWTNNTTAIGLAASGQGTINAFHAAANTGTTPLTATITVSPVANGCSGSNATSTVTVDPVPNVTATPSPLSVCNNAPAHITFTGTVAGSTYTWTNSTPSINLGDTGSNNISFVAANTGTTPVTATIIVTPAANNCTGKPDTIALTVNPTPTVIASPATQSICIGSASAPVQFTGSVNGTMYNWTNNNTGIGLGANGTGNIASFTTTSNGTLPATAAISVTPVANGCMGTSQPVTITVNPYPVVNVTRSPNTHNCTADSVVLYVNISAGYTYRWKLNSGVIPNAYGPSYSAHISGNYAALVTFAGCTTTSNIVPIQLNFIPPAPIYNVGGYLDLCPGDSAILGTVVNYNPSFTYQWQYNGANISGATNATYTVNNNNIGNYDVRVINNFCSNTSPVMAVTSRPAPATESISSLNNNAVICPGGGTNALKIDSLPGLVYQWFRSNSLIAGINTAEYVVDQPGNYTVSITNDSGCTTFTPSFNITTGDVPMPVITLDGKQLCTQGYSSYQWYLNGNAIANATGACYNPGIQAGGYTVTATNNTGCSGTSAPYYFSTAVSTVVPEVIKVFPNPAVNVVNIEASKDVDAAICSIDGKQLVFISNATSIDISRFSNAVYLIKIYDKAGTLIKVEKLVKAGW